MVTDGSYIPANVARESWVDVEVEVEQSMQSYLDCLDEELAQQPGVKKPPVKTVNIVLPAEPILTAAISTTETNVVLGI